MLNPGYLSTIELGDTKLNAILKVVEGPKSREGRKVY